MNGLLQFTATLTLPAFFLVAPFQATAAGEEPKVVLAADVLTQMRQSLANISSVRYDFEHAYTGRGRDGKETTRTTDASFAWSEAKYYCQNQLDSQPPIFAHLAFDGELYQRMDGGRMLLTVNAEIPKIPYGALQPILLPYLFVPRGDARLELEMFQREESWKEIISKATLGEPREIAGHACQVVKFSTTGGHRSEIHWEICAAGNLDYFPIQQSNYHGAGDRRTESMLSVKKFADLKTPRGRVIIPLEIEVVSLNAKLEKIQTTVTKVHETSIKINESIAKETFWLQRHRPIKTRFLEDVSPEQQERYEKGAR